MHLMLWTSLKAYYAKRLGWALFVESLGTLAKNNSRLEKP